jgi:hypothetical protein
MHWLLLYCVNGKFIMTSNALIEKLVFVQDLHWRKQNEHQKVAGRLIYFEKQLKL